MKLALLISLLWFCPTLALAFDASRELENLDQMGLADRTDKALNAIMDEARFQLTKAGHSADAEKLGREWLTYQGFVSRGLRMGDIGDHNPIQWMFKTWKWLDAILGQEVMHVTHLDSMWVFAFAIPVNVYCEDQVDETEYSRHFCRMGATIADSDYVSTGFAANLAYWLAWIACTASVPAPYDLACSPVALLAERVTWKRVAPRLSPRAHNWACSQG